MIFWKFTEADCFQSPTIPPSHHKYLYFNNDLLNIQLEFSTTAIQLTNSSIISCLNSWKGHLRRSPPHLDPICFILLSVWLFQIYLIISFALSAVSQRISLFSRLFPFLSVRSYPLNIIISHTGCSNINPVGTHIEVRCHRFCPVFSSVGSITPTTMIKILIIRTNKAPTILELFEQLCERIWKVIVCSQNEVTTGKKLSSMRRRIKIILIISGIARRLEKGAIVKPMPDGLLILSQITQNRWVIWTGWRGSRESPLWKVEERLE